MRILGATAAAGAAALLLGVAGADTAVPGVPDQHRSPGPELVAQAAIGLADLRPPAPSDAPAAPAPRHVPIPPRPEAVKVAPGPLGIPGAAYAAYRGAADRMALEAPACGIEWNLVAAIGRIESGHADGGNVDAAGNTLTPIQGPVLDGSLAGNAVIRDGEGFARALGPMQFLTTTWSLFGGDNSGDGKADVDNVRDAAYGAARYLCSSATGLQAEPAQRVAVFAYNQSNSYVDNVVAWSKAYRDRAIPVGGIPDMTAPIAPPTQLPKPLPPGQVVVVGCGMPDGAPSRPAAASGPAAPSGPGKPSAVPSAAVSSPAGPSAKPGVATTSAKPSGKPSGPAAPSSAARGPDGKPLPTTVTDCATPPPSGPSTPAAPSGPSRPLPPGPAPAGEPGPGGALAIPSGGPSTTRPVPPAAVRPAAPSVRPAPSSRPVPSSSPTVPRPPR
ncbi:lytic transglycosylase domain-containing protein [Tsukamurella tyrosinosolvens]|uniref:lytic transglycosylase domain-containing protein n=1 Tax=Tsukamurella tyrosinosolvens TaxID=57704 RepID=UPI000C7EA08B|nr:lytic transglycosylase domain-containing protein [Tsukamurella tyrosinosolvens]AUN41617.1 hypothetical protein ASU32_17710 [Tsukamurella tyrosinosolvens]